MHEVTVSASAKGEGAEDPREATGPEGGGEGPSRTGTKASASGASAPPTGSDSFRIRGATQTAAGLVELPRGDLVEPEEEPVGAANEASLVSSDAAAAAVGSLNQSAESVEAAVAGLLAVSDGRGGGEGVNLPTRKRRAAWNTRVSQGDGAEATATAPRGRGRAAVDQPAGPPQQMPPQFNPSGGGGCWAQLSQESPLARGGAGMGGGASGGGGGGDYSWPGGGDGGQDQKKGADWLMERMMGRSAPGSEMFHGHQPFNGYAGRFAGGPAGSPSGGPGAGGWFEQARNQMTQNLQQQQRQPTPTPAPPATNPFNMLELNIERSTVGDIVRKFYRHTPPSTQSPSRPVARFNPNPGAGFNPQPGAGFNPNPGAGFHPNPGAGFISPNFNPGAGFRPYPNPGAGFPPPANGQGLSPQALLAQLNPSPSFRSASRGPPPMPGPGMGAMDDSPMQRGWERAANLNGNGGGPGGPGSGGGGPGWSPLDRPTGFNAGNQVNDTNPWAWHQQHQHQHQQHQQHQHQPPGGLLMGPGDTRFRPPTQAGHLLRTSTRPTLTILIHHLRTLVQAFTLMVSKSCSHISSRVHVVNDPVARRRSRGSAQRMRWSCPSCPTP